MPYRILIRIQFTITRAILANALLTLKTRLTKLIWLENLHTNTTRSRPLPATRLIVILLILLLLLIRNITILLLIIVITGIR